VLIDVDEFKRYSDTYGHFAGDETLKRIATAIAASCDRAADLPARYGGQASA
jgi:two-component system, chemotaxis family, response regulator WspR